MKKSMTKKVASTHSNPKDTTKQKPTMLEEWENDNTFEKEIFTTSTLDRYCKEIVEWARVTEDAIKIQQWLALKGISYDKWNDWCGKYPKLQRAHNSAKMHIGNRRELGAITRKFDSGNTMFMMPAYDPQWENMLRLRAEIAEKKDNQKAPGWVIIEKAATTDMVPIKEEDVSERKK